MCKVLQRMAMVALVSLALSSAQSGVSRAQTLPALPWMNTSLSPEQRADLLIPQMTLDQKIQQMQNVPHPNEELEGCGFQSLGRHVEGIPELAIPTLRAINGGNGVRGGDCVPEPTATGLPSATNHPLSYFQPDPNGTWADGDWLTPAGDYTVRVGTSSADTPLVQTVTLPPPVRLLAARRSRLRPALNS